MKAFLFLDMIHNISSSKVYETVTKELLEVVQFWDINSSSYHLVLSST